MSSDLYEYRTYASHRANPHPEALTHPTRPGVLVPVEPAGTLNVKHRPWADPDAIYPVITRLPAGKYLIVEADDE